jgi:hypothetical protein
VVVASSDLKTASGTLNGSENAVTIPAGTVDSHGSYVAGTGYTCKVPGYYEVTAYLEMSHTSVAAGGQSTYVIIAKNGTSLVYGAAIAENTSAAWTNPKAEGVVNCSANDIISFKSINPTTGASFTASRTGSGFTIKKISGPAQIAASESVSALYTGAPVTGSIGASSNTITYGTKVKDSHNAYSGGAYTVPANGTYDISSAVRASTNTSTVGQFGELIINIDGVDKYNRRYVMWAIGAYTMFGEINVKSIPLVQGQIVRINTYVQGTSPAYVSDPTMNYFSISKTGNY